MYRTGRQRYIPKNKKTEESIQIRVATYLKRHYPTVVFSSDAGGLYMTMPMAVRWKRQNSAHARPDLFIMHRSADGRYAGMALELKADGTTIYVTRGPEKGNMTVNQHIRDQAACHELLRSQGYYADFACGYDSAVEQIDAYFGGEQTELF
jgi:hypothetical protein